MSVTSGAKRKEGGFAETIRVLIHACIIALVIRTFLFQPFNIPSGSMKATLLIGDYLFVSKYSYGYSQYSLPFSPTSVLRPDRRLRKPERGDVVVFRLPQGRLDRLHQARDRPAGRRIQMIDGVLNINGQPVKRERIDDFVDEDESGRTTAGQALEGDAAERRELHHARSGRQPSRQHRRSITCRPATTS